ncbi:MAG: hypothetical protein Q8R02_21020 [Hyphomonadaceae bacterium]|nr:hypothetical protein [Hyphomonadaceae bacterium]
MADKPNITGPWTRAEIDAELALLRARPEGEAAWVADPPLPWPGYKRPPPHPEDEIDDEDVDQPGEPAAATEPWSDGAGHSGAAPLFREEPRWPDEDASDPPGLTDPLSSDLLGGARHLLHWILDSVLGPAALALKGRIWQRAKYELLDMLRPLELLLRRILLIEAFALITSQALPASAAVRGRAGAARPARQPTPFDPAQPETWRVSFRIIPPTPVSQRFHRPERRPRRKLPPVDPHHFRCDPIPPLRHRKIKVPARPLACRLEAALRVILDPIPYARRLAFRLRRGANPKIGLLIDERPPTRGRRFARDALEAARQRAFTLYLPWWSSG